MTDVTIVVAGVGQMFITGPDVIKTVTGETVTHEELGGADTHFRISGVAHMVADDEDALVDLVRDLLAHLPSNNLEEPPRIPNAEGEYRAEALNTLLPDESMKAYDMHEVLTEVLDDGDSSRLQAAHAGEHPDRIRPDRRTIRRDRRQSAGGAGRDARYRRQRQGRPLRAALRRLQRPTDRLRGRARLPARD